MYKREPTKQQNYSWTNYWKSNYVRLTKMLWLWICSNLDCLFDSLFLINFKLCQRRLCHPIVSLSCLLFYVLSFRLSLIFSFFTEGFLFLVSHFSDLCRFLSFPFFYFLFEVFRPVSYIWRFSVAPYFHSFFLWKSL